MLSKNTDRNRFCNSQVLSHFEAVIYTKIAINDDSKIELGSHNSSWSNRELSNEEMKRAQLEDVDIGKIIQSAEISRKPTWKDISVESLITKS